jgi:hypothetical protein
MSESGTERSEGVELEAEAESLVEIFNDATPDYAPDLEWFAMSSDPETESEAFVLEAEYYIAPGGLEALRDVGRMVAYIEAYEKPPSGDAFAQIHVPVEGEVVER